MIYQGRYLSAARKVEHVVHKTKWLIEPGGQIEAVEIQFAEPLMNIDASKPYYLVGHLEDYTGREIPFYNVIVASRTIT